MKVVIALTAILAAIIGFWMWSNQPPPSNPSGDEVTPEVVISRSDERVPSSKSSQPEPEVASTSDERWSEPTYAERLELAKDIVRDLRGQQLLRVSKAMVFGSGGWLR